MLIEIKYITRLTANWESIAQKDAMIMSPAETLHVS